MKCSNPFFSKILLFGEYSVILHPRALAIPFDLFKGELIFPENGSKTVDSELKSFSQYLRHLQDKNKLPFKFDSEAFQFDISQGLSFKSTIPQGHGVGSSGALCAAIFARYAKNPPSIENLNQLKTIFSVMEGHFHGKSSGLDPLISYCRQPILVCEEGLRTVSIPDFDDTGPSQIFLLNTGLSRKTGPLVGLFMEKCKDPAFKAKVDKELIQFTCLCVQSLLEGHTEKLRETFFELSQFQLEEFTPMIPPLFQDLWRIGLESQTFALKLCGAGGGGFLLGICKDFKQAQEHLRDFETRSVLALS